MGRHGEQTAFPTLLLGDGINSCIPVHKHNHLAANLTFVSFPLNFSSPFFPHFLPKWSYHLFIPPATITPSAFFSFLFFVSFFLVRQQMRFHL
jgi:hypothetical protein